MELFKDKEQFIDIVIETSRALKINETLIEKDYYIIFFLSELNKRIPGLLFKGGTCCSHAYHAIDRFSEDIDLSLDVDHFGRSHNISANHKIVEICDEFGFKISNREEVIKHSHGNFNRYYIEYPISFSSAIIKPYIQVEMSFYQKAYPHENKNVTSIIGEWLISSGNIAIAEFYNLKPFNVCVQKLERTFIDKVFAICDYFEHKKYDRNSRHIYDLYKISQIINLCDPALKELVQMVRNDRKKNEKCISAKDGYDINSTLKAIVNTNPFESDYKEVTSKLLIKYIDYKEAIKVLNTIMELNLFS